MQNTQQPLISVAMCTFNGGEYLEEQLQSILDQTYRNLDIVIIDDCSQDSTMRILQSFSELDSRIRVLRNSKNLGFINNFSRALLECRGEYIALADQDDIWHLNKLEMLYQEISDNLLIYSAVSLIDQYGNPVDREFPRSHRIDGSCALSLLLDNCVTGHACLIHKSLLSIALPFPKGLLAHDQWLAIAAAASGRLRASEKVLSLYRMHGGNAILKSKNTRDFSDKVLKNRLKKKRHIELIKAVICREFLCYSDQILLKRLLILMDKGNDLYNYRLDYFLRTYKKEFLLLYKNKQKIIPKLCRGERYYRLNEWFSKLLN